MTEPRPAAASAYVIGAGPAGLAAAAVLRLQGVPTTVLERGPAVATSWRSHYDRLHLHTIRQLSGLPGLPIPASYGRWVGRDDLVRYLEQYAAHHQVQVSTGVEVKRIERAEPGRTDRIRWVLHTSDGGSLPARTVVVATGYNHTPYRPDWPGQETFTGQLLHAKDYRNPEAYQGLEVLVVGAGNTGAEIAADLADSGARRVRLAIRTPPHIVRREVAGWPAQRTGMLVRHLPTAPVDQIARWLARVSIPNLSRYGLRRPSDGLYTRVKRDGAIPVQDVGLIAAVQAGTVEPVASVVRFDGACVHLADGSIIEPNVVIAATGYRRGLDPMVGDLGVLNGHGLPLTIGGTAAQPGLYFVGYTVSLSGALRDIAAEARRVGRSVGREANDGKAIID
jgi:putative flavoprotein involved in K+ transport